MTDRPAVSAENADNGYGSSSSCASPSVNTEGPSSAKLAESYVGERRSCGAVRVRVRRYVAELFCPQCAGWEPYASDWSIEAAMRVFGLFPERRRRLLDNGRVVEELDSETRAG